MNEMALILSVLSFFVAVITWCNTRNIKRFNSYRQVIKIEKSLNELRHYFYLFQKETNNIELTMIRKVYQRAVSVIDDLKLLYMIYISQDELNRDINSKDFEYYIKEIIDLYDEYLFKVFSIDKFVTSCSLDSYMDYAAKYVKKYLTYKIKIDYIEKS